MATQRAIVGSPDFWDFKENFESRFQELTERAIPDCPMCTRNDWDGAGVTETPIEVWDPDPVKAGIGVFRCVLIVCRHCGYAASFALVHYDA